MHKLYVLSVLLLAVITVGSITPHSGDAIPAKTLFGDTFDDPTIMLKSGPTTMSTSDWSVIHGTWLRQDSMYYINTTDNHDGKTFVNTDKWANFFLDTDFTVESGDPQVGVFMRMTESEVGSRDNMTTVIEYYTANYRPFTQKWSISKYTDGVTEVLAEESGTSTIELGQQYHVRVMANKNKIQLWVDNEPKVMLVDHQLVTGNVGLTSDMSVINFDNVYVKSIGHSFQKPIQPTHPSVFNFIYGGENKWQNAQLLERSIRER